MHVFLTGASGGVGLALIPKLIEAGHSVSALSRTSNSDDKISKAGHTTIVRGSTTDLQVISEAASKADAVIHAAFNHDLLFQPNGQIQACDEDRAAISAMGDALVKSGGSGGSGGEKSLIYTFGTLNNLGPDEFCEIEKSEYLPRYKSVELVFSYAKKGLRAIVVKLPPIVHSPNMEHLFITHQIPIAKKSGFVGYVNDGSSLWCSTHVDDVASLLALSLTKGPSGVTLHAVAQEGISTKDIAEFMATKLKLETRSIPTSDASAHYGYFLGHILNAGIKTTAVYTKSVTGWQPQEADLFSSMQSYKSLSETTRS